MPSVTQRPLAYVVVKLAEDGDGKVIGRFAEYTHARSFAEQLNRADLSEPFKVMQSLYMKADQDVRGTEKIYAPNLQVTDGCGDWDSWDIKLMSQ